MNIIFIVIKKELLDTLRDKKTLFSVIILPAIAIPLLLFGVAKFSMNQLEKESTRQIKVAMINAPEAVRELFTDPAITLIHDTPLAAGKDSVSGGTFDAVLEFNPDFNTKINSMQAGELNLYYKSTDEMAQKRVWEKLDIYKSAVLSGRIQQLNISEELLNPLSVTTTDVASTKEQLGKTIGGFIPYLFILACFTGCMYTALDLTTGEKERGTMETLLTAPAARFHILFGKMATIAIVGICSATMAIAGLFAGLKFINEVPADILATVNDMLSVKFVLMLLAMLIPLSLFFAGLLSAIAIRASTFKEAQSYVTPLVFLVIMPAALALLPGIDLNWKTAFIPILNIALATKEIIAGTINTANFTIIIGSLVLFAVIAIFASLKQFSNENTILK